MPETNNGYISGIKDASGLSEWVNNYTKSSIIKCFVIESLAPNSNTEQLNILNFPWKSLPFSLRDIISKTNPRLINTYSMGKIVMAKINLEQINFRYYSSSIHTLDGPKLYLKDNPKIKTATKGYWHIPISEDLKKEDSEIWEKANPNQLQDIARFILTSHPYRFITKFNPIK